MFLFTEYHIAQNNRFFLDQVDLIEPARWNRMVQDVMLYSDAGLFAGDPVDEVIDANSTTRPSLRKITSFHFNY